MYGKKVLGGAKMYPECNVHALHAHFGLNLMNHSVWKREQSIGVTLRIAQLLLIVLMQRPNAIWPDELLKYSAVYTYLIILVNDQYHKKDLLYTYT